LSQEDKERIFRESVLAEIRSLRSEVKQLKMVIGTGLGLALLLFGLGFFIETESNTQVYSLLFALLGILILTYPVTLSFFKRRHSASSAASGKEKMVAEKKVSESPLQAGRVNQSSISNSPQ